MLSWLGHLIGSITGVFQTLWNDVISVITRVYNWLWSGLQTLWHDINTVLDALNHLAGEVASFIYHTYNTFVGWVEHYFQDVINWVQRGLNDITHYAESVYHWALSQLDNLAHAIESGLNDVYRWVLQNIWDPLYNLVSGTIRWIETEGAYVLDLVTHPEKLVTLIIGYVWKAWLSLFRAYAKPLIAFLLSQWRSVIPELLSVIEDIITTLL